MITLLMILHIPGLAGVTGKISGRIVDRENGEPLPGANIYIEDIARGGVSDVNGYYTILNIPAGDYTVKISMMGYAPVTIMNTRVNMELTTTLDIRLTPEDISMQATVIEAAKPLIEKGISASQLNVDSKKINNLPIQSITQVLSMQAGISDGLTIRGGSSSQTSFMVDGLMLNDERSNTPYTGINLSSIQEVKVQTGGFNAEYGNARSGVVNVVTREGDPERYQTSLTLRLTPAQDKHFGPSIYSADSYFNRPFTDPEVCWTGTENGAWDDYTQGQYPKFEGYNALSEAWLSDNDPTNDLTPTAIKRLFEWQRRRQGDITKPDYTIDLGLGGPIPLISKSLGKLRFFASYRQEREMLLFPLSRDSYRENNFQLKLTSDLTPATKLMVFGLYGITNSVCSDENSPPQGNIFRSPWSMASIIRYNTNSSAILYTPGYYNPTDIYRTMIGLKLTHIFSQKTYLEIETQAMINRYRTFVTEDRDTSSIYQIIPGYWTNEAPYGYYGYDSYGIGSLRMGGWMGLSRDKSRNTKANLSAGLTSQINRFNLVKLGIQFDYTHNQVDAAMVSPFLISWNFSRKWDLNPYRMGFYLQDMLEFEGMIANIGLRVDYSNPNTDWYQLAAFDPLLSATYGKELEELAEKQSAESHWALSPRLGVSFPISLRSKLYFNWGFFRSIPQADYAFNIYRDGTGMVMTIGNPNLNYSTTVAYEMGVSQNLLDAYLINIAAYYKDISDQPSWVRYTSSDNSVNYQKASNNSYEDIRGFEITVDKHIGRWISGFVNYTYMVQSSGYFDYTRYYQNSNQQRTYNLEYPPEQSRPRPQPQIRLNLDLHTPSKFGPSWNTVYPLAEWNLSTIAGWQEGGYTTWNPSGQAGVRDNVQWKDTYSLDFRLTRSFRIQRYQFQFYLDIINPFNIKTLNSGAFSNYNDYRDYMESLHFTWEKGAEHGHDRIGDVRKSGVAYQKYDPTDPNLTEQQLQKIKDDKAYINMPNLESLMYLNPRTIRFGLTLSL
ncbi:MAG: TonB-dependent receptor [Candidatus Delongbacteria bacterium]|nr:TonB-dependent receptor [Candidatus Delongbacteria bacterium]